MKDPDFKEKILFVMTVITLYAAAVFGYNFFKAPDSIFGPLFVLSGIALSIITNLWCIVWGIEISEGGESRFLDDHDPHEDITVDPLNIYNAYDKP